MSPEFGLGVVNSLRITFCGFKKQRINSCELVPRDKDNRKYRSNKLHVTRCFLNPLLSAALLSECKF